MNGLRNVLLSKKGIAILLIIVIAGFWLWKRESSQSSAANYQTSTMSKGSIVSALSVSGIIDQSNTTTVATQVSGTVTSLNIKESDTVKKGQLLAKITLDSAGQQQQTSSWNNYLSAKKAYESAKASEYSLQSSLFAANQKYINDAAARELATNDPTYIQEYADWLAAEANYKNQKIAITQTQAALNNASLTYQQSNPVITAPVSGRVIALNVTKGSQVLGTSSTAATMAIIQSEGTPIAQISLSEADITKVKNGMKTTLIIDSINDKTFTGSVVSINRVGTTSSGVTTYPLLVKFDSASVDVMPNMAVTANIILDSKQDVLVVPSAAVTTNNGQSNVKVEVNGQVVEKTVTVGIESDTEVEITSGLNEGDLIVIGTTAATTTTTTRSTQNSGFGLPGIGGGGAVRTFSR